MRILCLTDFPIRPPDRWIWNYVNSPEDEVDFLWTQASDRFPRWGKLVARYPAYYRLAVTALMQMTRQKYDLVVAWEGKVGIPMALLRQLFCGNRPPFVILTFTPGEIAPILYPLVRIALGSVDHVTVLTKAEQDAYQRMFNLPSSKISLCLLGTYDSHPLEQELGYERSLAEPPYIHASGRSARDYATMIKAVTDLNIKAIIHGRGYNFDKLKLPTNVEIGEFVPIQEYRRLVLNSLFEVVPLKDTLLPVGSSQIVFSMMMGKAIVATQTASTIDYLEHGVSGLLVKPGDSAAMRTAIQYLHDHPEETRRMGAAARQRYRDLYTFASFSKRAHTILHNVAFQ